MAGDTATNARGWQPIETAPKDGTHILLWQYEPGGSWGGIEEESGYTFVGYFDRGQWYCTEYDAFCKVPLRWMPIPAPDSITITQAEYKRLVEDSKTIERLLESVRSEVIKDKKKEDTFGFEYLAGWNNAIRWTAGLIDTALKAAREK